MAALARDLIDNPIERAELSHQQRANTDRRWRRFPALFGLGLGVALISNAGLLVAPQVAPLMGVSPLDLTDALHGWFSTITILMGALIMIHHLAFASAALQLGTTTIAREKHARTWESLLLTGVDARRIIYGKWMATMRTLWEAYRPLLILRFAAAIWMIVEGASAYATPINSTPPLLGTLLIGLATALFPLWYAGFTVALGMLASLLMKDEIGAQRVGSLLFFGALVVSISLIVLAFMISFSDIEPSLASLIPALFVTPIDSGMLALIGIVANDGAASFYYLGGLIVCIIVYAALALGLLRIAQTLAIRQRATPPTRR
ncbi:MAG TPA: hypothetical protein VHD90_24895 [Phototrophicaceae bacterium]|nr:hypothetical protein [Phototrophicaceae bacterium]